MTEATKTRIKVFKEKPADYIYVRLNGENVPFRPWIAFNGYEVTRHWTHAQAIAYADKLWIRRNRAPLVSAR